MYITILDKVFLVLKIYSRLYKMPFKYIFKTFCKPVESTRYIEFAYLLKFLKSNKLKSNSKVLDVSSPFVMAYLLKLFTF